MNIPNNQVLSEMANPGKPNIHQNSARLNDLPDNRVTLWRIWTNLVIIPGTPAAETTRSDA